MTTRRRVKAPRAELVAVIASSADLAAGAKMNEPPDLFELRLDSLFPIDSGIEKKLCRLHAPLIITARDPQEGGIGSLSFEQRQTLLKRFLAQARYLDVELRSGRKFKTLLSDAKKQKVRRILSYHNFKSTPSLRSLCAKARQAKALGADIFKVATRVDTPAALSRLVTFVTNKNLTLPVSVMGIGKLGAISRLLLARCGSVLNYASLHGPTVEGQLSIAILRSALRR